MKNTLLSIVIPVWNEAENIAPLVERIHATLLSQKITYEIIFVDDHSQDNTTAIIKKFAKTYPIRLFVKKVCAEKLNLSMRVLIKQREKFLSCLMEIFNIRQKRFSK